MEYGIEYEEKDVIRNPKAFEEMKHKSGQALAPTLDWQGKILADFGVKELKPFLQQQNVRFEDS